MPIRSAVAAVSLALLLPALASARIQQTPAAHAKPAATPAPKQPASFRTELLADLDEVQKKVTDLAAAVPAEKYTWRPAEGVRSVSEVYMHIAGGNYFLVTFLGIQPPADMPKEIESITDKQKVLSELQKSFDHVRTAARNTSDAEMEQTLTMLGNQTTKRGVFVTILNHLHEHLGQSIAYARMNGIVPPWSK
jgi:uncharacterized damage-inducible protein DinB